MKKCLMMQKYENLIITLANKINLSDKHIVYLVLEDRSLQWGFQRAYELCSRGDVGCGYQVLHCTVLLKIIKIQRSVLMLQNIAFVNVAPDAQVFFKIEARIKCFGKIYQYGSVFLFFELSKDFLTI